MILTEKLLKEFDACKKGLDFCKRNKLYGFNLDRIEEIIGDHNGFIYWITRQILAFKLEYDEQDRLVNVGNTILYEYDDRNNVIKKTYSSGIVIIYWYDGRNNRIYERNSNCGSIEYEYDGYDRLIKKIHTNNTTKVDEILYPFSEDKSIVEYEYNNKGNLIKEIMGDNYTEYEYDDNNNIISKTYDVDYVIRYEYDDNGGLLREYKPLLWGKVIHHTIQYYPNGQLKQYDDLHIPLI